MTTFRRGEILLAQIAFTVGSATEKRPVLVLSGNQYNDKREEIVVAGITSNDDQADLWGYQNQNMERSRVALPFCRDWNFHDVQEDPR